VWLSHTGLLWYLLGICLALYTCFTIFTIPYLAWGAELARGYHERTAIVQVRSLLGLLGGVAGASVPLMLVSGAANPREGYAYMGLLLGLVVAAAALIPGLTVRDDGRDRLPNASFGHFLQGLRHTFANRDFRIIFVTFCLMTVSAAMGTAIQIVVGEVPPEPRGAVSAHRADVRGRLRAVVPVLARPLAAHRQDAGDALRPADRRRRAVRLGARAARPARGDAGLHDRRRAATGCLTLFGSQAMDIVDVDELQTGEQRAGAYFGIWAFGSSSRWRSGSFSPACCWIRSATCGAGAGSGDAVVARGPRRAAAEHRDVVRTVRLPPHQFRGSGCGIGAGGAGRAPGGGGIVTARARLGVVLLGVALLGAGCAAKSDVFGALPPIPGGGKPTPSGVIWHDLLTADPAGVQRFYGGLFGWQFTPVNERYALAHNGDRVIGGIATVPASDGSQWLPQFSTPDIDRSLYVASRAGGTVLLGPIDVGARGRMAIVRDPQAAIFG
jgi:predicted enzyme related to lactoylglutathione lyase